jgi:general secretion pathway protein E
MDPDPQSRTGAAAGAADDALRALAAQLGLPFVEAVPDEWLDPALIAHVPVDWAREHGVLPARRHGQPCALTAAPQALDRLDDLGLMVGEELAPVAAPRAAVLDAIERCYFRKRESPEQFLRGLDAEPEAPTAGRPARAEDLLSAAEAAPVTQLVNLILLEAVQSRASDIHFEPYEDRLRVRYRVDGVLYEKPSPPKHLEAALVSRLKVMAHMDIAERRLPQDGMARVRVGEREIDIRASTIPVAEGERVVLRLLNRDSSLLPLGALGMPPAVRAPFEELLRQANGLILVCGPTGSGKTTTLYAAVRGLDTAGKNVLTIEEPIEYQLPDIGQMQVKPKIGLTFASGLRHMLRQDPDVILVGETRDAETAEIAVRASLTGHLVFTTLHTNDAASAVIRMLDMGVPAYLLAAALRGALAQRLVRRLCPRCRRPGRAAEAEAARLGAAAARRLAGAPVWQPAGCDACLNGYRGRIGIFELLLVNDAVRQAIRAGEDRADALRAAAAGGPPAAGLLDDALGKVLAGETSLEEVLTVLGTTAAARPDA